MTKPKIGILLSTTRQSRFADRPAKWLLDLAQARDDADYELVDLRDFAIPFFDSAASPRFVPVADDAAVRFARKMAGLDGVIFVTAEYNHSMSAVLKNALDHLYDELAKKPAAFVGYGAVGAARAVEHLRLTAVELGMAPTKSAVHIGMEPFLGMLQSSKDFADYPYLAESVTPMLDELVWYAAVLRAGRDAVAVQQAA